MRTILPCVALLSILVLAACGKQEEAAPVQAATGEAPAAEEALPEEPPMPSGDFRVVAVELGSRLDEEGRVAAPRDVFAPGDSIHAAVVGVGTSPGLTLSARWLAADGTEVAKAGQSLSPEAPTVATFTVSKTDPWPTGAYRVEVAINDRVVETRAFEVR